MITAGSIVAFSFLTAVISAQAADTMKAFPPAGEGMVRYVLQLPKQDDESVFRVELMVGKTVAVDEANTYFFGGQIEKETIKGWGYPRYTVKKLGPMGGTLMAVDPNAPKVDRFVRLGGEPYFIRCNSRLPILVSDGKKNVGTDAQKTAQEVKNKYGDNVCFYTVLVGDDPGGKALLDEIASIGNCGFATTADDVYSSEGMAAFVSSVFCTGEPPVVVAVIEDADGDGILDNLDKCPNTPKGATVNEYGCWAYQGDILFDFDKYDLKPGAYPILDEAIAVYEKNPGIKVEVQGYTDSIGTEEYNLGLSERRAKTVEAYLEGKGVDPNAISAKGYGEANPVASNDTKEGRAQNRRVEFRAAE